MACGTPVLMKRNEILEILDDLKDIILFYNNEEELKKIIKEKIENEKERNIIAKKSRIAVENHYSWDAVAKMYVEEMKSVIDGDDNEKLY